MATVIAVAGSEAHAAAIAEKLGLPVLVPEVRRFPDGELYVRVDADLAGQDVILVGTLTQPADKFLLVAFLAATARDLGARRVGLVAPYLAFMRQDMAFQRGEGVTARYFAKLLSGAVSRYAYWPPS